MVFNRFYDQNFVSRNPLLFHVNEELKKTAVAISAPASARLPLLDIRDYGKWVRAAIEEPKYLKGGELIAATEWVTIGEAVKDLAKGAGLQLEEVILDSDLKIKYNSHRQEHRIRTNIIGRGLQASCRHWTPSYHRGGYG